jgi:SAM-dependent methyltransferase
MVQEWCEQQTVAGMLHCTDPASAPTDREFVLPAAVAGALLDRGGEAWVAPLVELLPGITGVLDDVASAFRAGGGVPFHAYGAPLRHGLGDLNGAAFEAALPTWLDDVPAARDQLAAPDSRLLDLGCGTGRSSVAIALAHPDLRVHGVDLDAASIEDARGHAAAWGVADRVTFEVADAATVAPEPGTFGVVVILEALHDMGDPVGALCTARVALAPGGVCYLADERVADNFGPDVEVVERLQYGFSVLHCLPATLAEDPVQAHGTILRAPTVGAWAGEAGFDTVDRLDVEDLFWQHYALLA